MNVICIEDVALQLLVKEVYEKLKQDAGKPQDRWVDTVEAMRILQVKSKTTLQHLRNHGKIRFSQPQKKIILYDKQSLEEYLEKHSNETF